MINSFLSPLTTGLSWRDLNTDTETRHQIDEIVSWLRHAVSLKTSGEMKKAIGPGYRALFYGPGSKEKTLTAALIGKETGITIYRVDLSKLVSKYIGETEKNLDAVFKEAEKGSGILFFDEADALFGKRTDVKDSHDKYANMETSYLMQRIENFNGLVILSTNLRNNIDDAFIRRFQTLIHFGLPKSKGKK